MYCALTETKFVITKASCWSIGGPSECIKRIGFLGTASVNDDFIMFIRRKFRGTWNK